MSVENVPVLYTLTMLDRAESSSSVQVSTLTLDAMKSSAGTTRTEILDGEKGYGYAMSTPVKDCTLPKRPWRRSVTPWSEIIGHKYAGAGTTADPYEVTWLPDTVERENPYRWKTGYKWFLTMMCTSYSSWLTSSCRGHAGCDDGLVDTLGDNQGYQAAVSRIQRDAVYHGYATCSSELTAVTNIYILGFVVGPFIWAPFSEVFGRRLTVIVSFIPLTAFNAAVCGSTNLNGMLVLRFIAGTFGCSSMTNSG